MKEENKIDYFKPKIRLVDYLFNPRRRLYYKTLKECLRNPPTQDFSNIRDVCKVGETFTFDDGSKMTLVSDDGNSVVVSIEGKPTLWAKFKKLIKRK